MPVFLLVNDDGVNSPMLRPTIAQLQALGTVRMVVPAEEQSWKAKAMTRFGRLLAEPREGYGIEAYTVTGTPADCVNLGVHQLFGDPPDWVISGINIGQNTGLAFALNSGTVGAAFEAALLGIPAVAFSHRIRPEIFRQWSTEGRLSGEEAETAVREAAEAVGRMMPVVLAHGLPGGTMMLNVNFPHDVNPDTPVRWTRLRHNRYGSLFERDGEGYRHAWRGDAWWEEAEDDDRGALESGAISVTPLTLGGLNVPGAEPLPFV